MSDQLKTLEEIHNTLKTLRGNPSLRNRFPKKLWDSIIQLTKVLPLQEICRQLDIQPAYLKHKIQQTQNLPAQTVDFQEVVCDVQGTGSADVVVIELISDSGLRARIQGPSTCLNYLSSLFGGK